MIHYQTKRTLGTLSHTTPYDIIHHENLTFDTLYDIMYISCQKIDNGVGWLKANPDDTAILPQLKPRSSKLQNNGD